MKSLVINMSLGTVEQNEEGEAEYSEEVLYAGLNSTLALVQLVPEAKKEAMPAELATVDAELFLQKMDKWQR